jgi:chemotaxis protein methyltransferase CheR
MGWDEIKARDKAASLIGELSRKLGETPEEVFRLIRKRSDKAFMDMISPHITVGETFFFRDRKALDAFGREIVPRLASRAKRPINVWSAGCSTGEEPYTLAMIMDHSILGLAGGFRVYGTDLNENSLKKARQGMYGRWSFRGMSDMEISRYFDVVGDDRFKVKDRYRSRVSFESANLVSSSPLRLRREDKMDVIFCRNVMMYFDEANRTKVLRSFREALSPDGWLVVAACETSILDGSPFHPVRMGEQTFFTVEEGPSAPPERYLLDSAVSEIEPEVEAVPSCDGDLIRSLADRGMSDEALELCLSSENSTDPYVHYLMSVIYQDRGELDFAKDCLRKALFLRPSFVMAHFALLGIAVSQCCWMS